MTWTGALKKQAEKLGLSNISQATPQQLETIYENIANGASKTFGVDKMALGDNFKKFFIDKIPQSDYQKLLDILNKYRMNNP